MTKTTLKKICEQNCNSESKIINYFIDYSPNSITNNNPPQIKNNFPITINSPINTLNPIFLPLNPIIYASVPENILNTTSPPSLLKLYYQRYITDIIGFLIGNNYYDIALNFFDGSFITIPTIPNATGIAKGTYINTVNFINDNGKVIFANVIGTIIYNYIPVPSGDFSGFTASGVVGAEIIALFVTNASIDGVAYQNVGITSGPASNIKNLPPDSLVKTSTIFTLDFTNAITPHTTHIVHEKNNSSSKK